MIDDDNDEWFFCCCCSVALTAFNCAHRNFRLMLCTPLLLHRFVSPLSGEKWLIHEKATHIAATQNADASHTVTDKRTHEQLARTHRDTKIGFNFRTSPLSTAFTTVSMAVITWKCALASCQTIFGRMDDDQCKWLATAGDAGLSRLFHLCCWSLCAAMPCCVFVWRRRRWRRIRYMCRYVPTAHHKTLSGQLINVSLSVTAA